jgi:CRP-like cAMP-binding protein
MFDPEFYASFFEYMGRSVPLDREAMQIIADHSKPASFEKGQILLREGEVCDKVYFVVSGKARSYYTDLDGKTLTWSFHFNHPAGITRNIFAVDYRSFLTGEPSLVTIETLTLVEALLFTRQETTYLIEHLFVFERWMRRLNERAFAYMYDRAFTLLTKDARARYMKMLEEEPHLLQLFSNYYVASYLGVAPQSLSRIRSQG